MSDNKESKRVKEQRREDHKDEALNPPTEATATGKDDPADSMDKSNAEDYEEETNLGDRAKNQPKKQPLTDRKAKAEKKSRKED
ncbi:MAG: hypothetical protein R3345_03005 [Fulvivirga sp.]|nr:hypothetical protein [Fulvivirga sp.]